MKRFTLIAVAFAVLASPLCAQEKAQKIKTPLDQAIDRALDYLHNNQDSEGAWSAGYRGGKNPAITALAVMAFMSAGNIPGEGRHGDVIRKGIQYVLKNQAPNGLFGSEGNYEMYAHGICTLMLAEAIGMTDGKLADDIRGAVVRGVNVIKKAQRKGGYNKGGWRYRAFYGDDADISVTGWQLMALRAAKNVGCDVPPEAIDNAVEFIGKCYDPYTGGYRYLPGAQVTLACTGTSILALELCGKKYHRSATSLKAGSFILRNDLSRRGPHYYYGIYYCSQAMFQLGDNYWNTFRSDLHDQLLTNQNSQGSWSGRVSDDAMFGPNYCTSMAVLALTVEYRFLPIYQRDEEPAEDKK